MNKKIEEIRHADEIMALIVRSGFERDGIEFFTPDHFSQQIGYMNRPAGYVIEPHVHIPAKREVLFTKEVLLVKKGKVRVDFYTDNEAYVESRVLCTGDLILLATGGHGFEMLEDTEMYEVKQGPYAGDRDKRRFTPDPSQQICIRDGE
jgi:hypothetical protein